MIDISAYYEKLEIALQQKSNPSYKTKIQDELSKSEWQERLFGIERTLSNIKDEKDFIEYQKSLTKLFNDLYEVITAPGVDYFISWVDEITADKNNANSKKLRKYLVDHYADSNISNSIESINSNKAILEIENSIFYPLLKDITKELKKQTDNLLKDPSQFENNIDDYFETLTTTLDGLESIQELQYSKNDQLYTDNQKASHIDFYNDYLKSIIDRGQSLKPQNETEKTQSIIIKVENRVKEIKKGISLLHDSKVALSQDETLKSIFLKLDKEVNYEKGVLNALNQFIDETWAEVEDHYNKIKNFFNQSISINFNPNWNSFSKKGGVISIIDEYTKIIGENVLTTNSNKSSDVTKKILKAKAKSIEKYLEQQTNLKDEIEVEFNERVKEFEAKSKIQLLQSLSSNNQELLKIKQGIESNIEGLKGGILKLNENNNIILFLRDYFTSTFNCFNEIRSEFEVFLQKSGMEKHLEWVEKKCNNSSEGVITTDDLNDVILIKKLLEQDLIKIEIKKKY
ncbi:hypothetical protein [Shivajiella indica]|uniref:Uncharacterized protein n=1 Tax=Shivajiella indica TaxID=872115 RepID=A0ABW5BA79_9BACT